MEELDLKELLSLFWSKIFQIIVIVLITTGVGIIYTYGFTTPKYSSSTTLVLTGSEKTAGTDSVNSITTTDVTLNSKLVSTYSELVKSSKVLRQVISNLGIDVNEEELRNIATNTLQNLSNGQAKGITVNRNLTVYTSLPTEREELNNAQNILETLVRNHSLVLIDCDFDTPFGYFSNAQEIYLVQTLDILTIQPLTAFLRELKAKNILDQNKIKIILNKYVKVRGISEKTIIGGMAFYNDPAMSFMTELFDRNTVKYMTIPFEQEIYTRYLESIINCDISIKGYSKAFIANLKELNNMVYPTPAGNNIYRPQGVQSYNNGFSASMNNTLNQMKRKY